MAINNKVTRIPLMTSVIITWGLYWTLKAWLIKIEGLIVMAWKKEG